MTITPEIYKRVLDIYGNYYEPITGILPQKLTDDVLSFKKPIEQIAVIERYSGSIKGKKLLEVGSGFGIFVVTARQNGIEAYGVEPDSEGFNGSYELSQEILSLNEIDPGVITSGIGEALPLPDHSFDVVYSTNVLEHVSNPRAFLGEAIRVCKPGGFIQIVVPNYGSFYDGHYSCFYVPYQPKWLWKIFIKLFHKKDISYIDTLRTEINYFAMLKWLKPYVRSGAVSILGMGEDIFRERMDSVDFSAWAGLEKVKNWLALVHKFRITELVIWLLLATKSYSPLIVTIRKNK
ncbi:MAG: class I SAM-dependent methyltransferase [Candidatus Paceibacterota bacterium]|jgi:ubiquinone/menaquinone biosynthesis C-methylase UbiE